MRPNQVKKKQQGRIFGRQPWQVVHMGTCFLTNRMRSCPQRVVLPLANYLQRQFWIGVREE